MNQQDGNTRTSIESRHDEERVRIAKAVADQLYGGIKHLTSSEKQSILDGIDELLGRGHSPDSLIAAAEVGIWEVWPFSEGQPPDIDDLVENISKAKAAAYRKRRESSREILVP